MVDAAKNRKSALGEWKIRDQYFSDVHMFTRIKTVAELQNLRQTYRALYYMKEKHQGQTRKAMKYSDAQLPYIVHPLMMACHAMSMNLLDDELLAATLLHDVCEDCGTAPEELPVNEQTREAVRLVTKPENFGKTDPEYRTYYEGIAGNRIALIVKLLDRCNNISSMATSFTDEHMAEYIKETQEYIHPLMKRARDEYPEYSNQLFLIRYHMNSVLETVRHHMRAGV